MSIQDQLQIVEDNLNEYGQCNITLEEFNYFKEQISADERKRITDILKDELESGYLLEKLLRRIAND